MGGQVQQQPNAAAATATAFYDNAAGGDAGDAVMARWLQSNGLQHLASPLAVSAPSADQRLLPNLLMQGYGAQSAEEKQRLFKLMRNLNFNGESASEPYTPHAQTLSGLSASDGYYSPDFRGDFGAGLLDLHAMDDTELLSEDVLSEPFEPSPFIPGVSKGFENDFNLASGGSQKEQLEPEQSGSFPSSDKESSKESNVAKIKVVVRKRPLNKKELSRKEDDIVSVCMNSLSVHEPKVKVDLTAYVEKHEFCFDAVLDEQVTNDEVYRVTVEPIIPTIFQRTKATCFAYGQTGSGKTFTMQPLPLRAAHDLVRILHQPVYRNQKFKLWLSFFEIYGGKLFDLLSDRKKLCMREDGRQQVCIVGLQEFEVSDVQLVKEYIEKGNATRSTGSTGANEESSRSHAILQLVVKKHPEVKETRRNADANETKVGKVVGKISFIDLAGSERGADTTDNDRQTRIEGAEINKSLLALKECIRALDNDQIHIPFRGSKLTEVLRDSFVGNSRTVMISCISPNAGSCEHTLNTLRYADRVKSLSKSGNAKKDPVMSSLPLSSRDVSTTTSVPISTDAGEDYESEQDAKPVDNIKRLGEKEPLSYNPSNDYNKLPSSSTSSYTFSGREESGLTGSLDRERFENDATTYTGSTSQKMLSSQPQKYSDTEGKAQKVSPPRRKAAPREEKSEKFGSFLKKDGGSDLATTNSRLQSSTSSGTPREEKTEKSGSFLKKDSGFDLATTYSKHQNTSTPSVTPREEKSEKLGSFLKKDGGSDLATTDSRQQNASTSSGNSVSGSRKYEPDPPSQGKINAILEEEEALIAAHRKEIEDTMEIVREEMKLLAEVDQPGSLIDNYVTQLSFVLSRKAAGLVSLQARLARFQHRLKEQEILSRKRVPR